MGLGIRGKRSRDGNTDDGGRDGKGGASLSDDDEGSANRGWQDQKERGREAERQRGREKETGQRVQIYSVQRSGGKAREPSQASDIFSVAESHSGTHPKKRPAR